jgi:hypothetical protein
MDARKQAAKMAAELIRELAAEMLAGLEQEIVALVASRLDTLKTKQPVDETDALHNDLMVTPDKKHQH